MHIYLITNMANGKMYVGQTVNNNLNAYLRRKIRLAQNNHKGCTHLFRAIRKHGPNSFTIQPLYEAQTMDELNKAEIAFIELFGTRNDSLGYNITAGGGGQLGVKRPHTEEWKKEQSIRSKEIERTPEWKERISLAQKGRPLSEKHRAALKGSHRGKHKSKRSAEHSAKIAENKRKWWAMKKQEVANAA